MSCAIADAPAALSVGVPIAVEARAEGELATVGVIIPAYKPSRDLLDTLDGLRREGFGRVFVVDDGSGSAFREVFDEASAREHVVLVRHAVNLGKGAALRTGMHAAMNEGAFGAVVTADADGQHLPADIARVARRTLERDDTLVLGSRAFKERVPLRSAFGNITTRWVTRVFSGLALSDTQTGLRGLPVRLLPALLRLPLNGYEFEMEMLLTLRQRGCRFDEVPIETVYIDGNASSHFRVLRDSMRIYAVFARYLVASASTALIDLLLFAIVFQISGYIGLSMVLARTGAGVYQFVVCRSLVFRSGRSVLWSAARYVAVVALSGAISYAVLTAGVIVLGGPVLWWKIIAELVLFVGIFAVQRVFVFPPPVAYESEAPR
mgnify:CR=1 FL=1